MKPRIEVFTRAAALLAAFFACAIACGTQIPRRDAVSERSWTDGKVTLVVESIERGSELSARVKQGMGPSSGVPRAPSLGNEYLTVVLIFKKINSVHVTSPGSPILYDTEGRKYAHWNSVVAGVQYLRDSFDSPYWIVEGATALSIFQVPKACVPARLTFVYGFKEGWDQKSEEKWRTLAEKTGNLEIDLKQYSPK